MVVALVQIMAVETKRRRCCQIYFGGRKEGRKNGWLREGKPKKSPRFLAGTAGQMAMPFY